MERNGQMCSFEDAGYITGAVGRTVNSVKYGIGLPSLMNVQIFREDLLAVCISDSSSVIELLMEEFTISFYIFSHCGRHWLTDLETSEP